jgi:hypothetical protein
MFGTIMSAAIMLFLAGRTETRPLFFIRIGVALLLVCLKTIHTYHRHHQKGIRLRHIISYSVDIIGLILLMFVARSILPSVIILSVWVSLGLLVTILFVVVFHKVKKENPDFLKRFFMNQEREPLDAHKLDAIPDDRLVETIIMEVISHIRGLPEEACGSVLEGLHPKFRKTFLIASLNFHVENGGFEQYFDSASGYFAFETIEALRDVGATEEAVILQDALGQVNSPSIDDYKFRQMNHLLFKSNELLPELGKLSESYKEKLQTVLSQLIKDIRTPDE